MDKSLFLHQNENNYRYYLCVEKSNKWNNWECLETIYPKSLNVFEKSTRTTVVKINKLVPHFMDEVIIKNKLKPKLKLLDF